MFKLKPNTRSLFWNVDTQVDFMNSEGKLYVTDAEQIKDTLAKITKFAKDNNVQVVNTADWHYADSAELSETPDFINTFPPHCMANTPGAELIPETKPEKYDSIIDWKNPKCDIKTDSTNFLVLKDKFDVFTGNQFTKRLIDALNPDVVYVYGVATNVCVDCAVNGLLDNGYKVVVFEDAIKELPNIPSPIQNWIDKGAEIIKFTN
jgi:nicotinamidase/pyrazinamidase